MPPVVVAIAAGLAAGSLVTVGLGAAIAIGVSVAGLTYSAMSGLTPEVDTGGGRGVGPAEAQGILLNKSGNTEAIPAVYGERRVGGIPVLREVTGGKNRKLHCVYILSEGPIESVDAAYFNDTEVEVRKEISQQVVFRFTGLIHHWIRLRVRCVEPGGVAGTYTDLGSNIASLYAADGGHVTIIKESKRGSQNGTYEFTPFDATDIAVDDNITVHVTDMSSQSSYDIIQRPTAANNWELEIQLYDRGKDVNQNSFEITLSKTKKVLEPSYSTASEVWPILGNQYLGNARSAEDEAVIQRIRDDLPGVWPVSARLSQLAALYVVFDHNPEVFQNLPTVSADIKGLIVYDPRSGLDAYSNNFALCMRDYLTNTIYGRSIPVADFDDASVINEANYCDELLPENSEKRYVCNGVVNIDKTHMQNIVALNSCAKGMLFWVAGKWQLLIDRDEVPTGFEFNEDNITGSWTMAPAGKKDLANQVEARFFNKNENWQDDIDYIDSPAKRLEDGGALLKRKFEYPFTSERWRVKQLATIQLNQSRQSIRASFTATIAGQAVSVGDVVTVTHSTPGWVSKPVRVLSLDLQAGGDVAVSVIEHDSSVYNYGVIAPDSAVPDTNLPDFFNIPSPGFIDLESGTEHLLAYDDGTILSRIYFDIGSVDYASSYEVEYKKSTEDGWVVIRTIDTRGYIVGVEDGTAYDVRARALTVGGPGEWHEEPGHVVIGKTAPPADVQNFSVIRQPDGTRQFGWSEVPDLDLAGYKIRYKLGVETDWNVMTPLHKGLLVSNPFETNLLAAGFYTVAIVATDNTGNDSANPTFIASTLGDPRIKNSFFTSHSHIDGWPGTKTNCEVDSVGMNLVSLGNYDWDSLTDWGSWTAWSSPSYSSIIYQEPDIDLGAVLPFIPLITVDVQGNPTIEVDVSTDNVVWNGWHTPTTTETARYLRVRCTLNQIASEILLFRSMTIVVSGDVQKETINDSDTSGWGGSAAAGRTVPISKSYSVITNVQMALQNVGAGYTWEIINKDTAGPTIRIFNNSGVAVDATVDVEISGYPLV